MARSFLENLFLFLSSLSLKELRLGRMGIFLLPILGSFSESTWTRVTQRFLRSDLFDTTSKISWVYISRVFCFRAGYLHFHASYPPMSCLSGLGLVSGELYWGRATTFGCICTGFWAFFLDTDADKIVSRPSG